MTDDPTPATEQTILPCGLTPEQQKAWNNTANMFLWKCPGFNYLFTKLLAAKEGDWPIVPTKSVPIAATDGRRIMVNPDTFFQFDLMGRVFVLAHEVMHNVYNDVNFLNQCAQRGTVPTSDGKYIPFNADVMQRAMDFRINAVLLNSHIGTKPKDNTGTERGHYDDEVTGDENLLDIYQKAYEAEQDKPEGKQPGGGNEPGQGGAGNNPGGFDNVMPPGASTGEAPSEAANQRNEQQWQVELANAQHAQKTHGSMPAAMQRMFDKLLQPEVYWLDHIQAEINRIAGSGAWDWTQPDPYWIPHEFFSPHATGKGAGWIVMWGDTSGSRDDQEIASTVAETSGIMEDLNPERLTMIWCDAKIQNIEELTEAGDLRNLKPKGGGGTKVEPVFDWIRKQAALGEMPDLFIGFTDGELHFPPPPNMPIIWASSTDNDYPYGKVVRVNKRNRQ